MTRIINGNIKFLILTIMLLSSLGIAQSQVHHTQQAYLMKKLDPQLGTLGVISSQQLNEDQRQAIMRAFIGHGITVVFGFPNSTREIPGIYRQLRSVYRIDAVWIPEDDDPIVLVEGFEFLRQNTIRDRVSLYVPRPELVASGAFASINTNGGSIIVYINERVASVVGIASEDIEAIGVQVTFLEN